MIVYYFLLLIQQFIASTTHIVVKSTTNTVDPRLVVLLRGCFATTAFSIWMFFKRDSLKKIDKSDYFRFILLGFINIPLNQLAFISGLKFTTAPNAALLYAITPTFVFLIGIFFFREKLSLWKGAGIAIAFAGTAIVLFQRGIDFNSAYFLGNLLVFSASFSWALFTVLGRPLILKYGAIQTTAIVMILGLILYLPIFAWVPTTTSVFDLTIANWLQLAYLGIITSGIAYALWYIALSKIESSKVAVFNNFQPIITTFLAMIFFDQQPSILFVVGGMIAIAGVIITQRG